MIYPILKKPRKLQDRIHYWARLHRDRLGILSEYRRNGEVRLIPATQPRFFPPITSRAAR